MARTKKEVKVVKKKECEKIEEIVIATIDKKTPNYRVKKLIEMMQKNDMQH